MSLPAPFNPDHFEFRLSPDRRQFAIWQPGNEPWFVPEAAMQGRWLKPNDMDRLGWTRYVPVDDTPPAAVEPSDQPRLFHLQRDHDVSGVSGTGRVANGVLWPDGTVSLRWIGERPSTVSWDRLADAEHVHGRGGATRIVWADEQPAVTRALVLLAAAERLHEVAVTRPLRDAEAIRSAAAKLRRMADEAAPMVGSFARDGFGADEIAEMLDADTARRIPLPGIPKCPADCPCRRVPKAGEQQ
ncbi:hypothetical protein [Streptomyces sp. NPDC057623]|uniref:hypothetical protein n=1 Tax=Streptomyces sp. NPDC057623 TaxID=3346187 RepID=UPI00369AA208